MHFLLAQNGVILASELGEEIDVEGGGPTISSS